MAPPIETRCIAACCCAVVLAIGAVGVIGAAEAQAPPSRALSSRDATMSPPLGPVPGAGASEQRQALATADPFSGQPQAIAEGQTLFQRMNCVYCHGIGAKGLMGPSLVNGAWRYGGTPIQVFRSISDGRPQGMPSWRLALPADSIWKIVAYIESLGGMLPPGGGERPGTTISGEHP